MDHQDSVPFGEKLTTIYKDSVTASEDENKMMLIDVKNALILYAKKGKSSISIKDLETHIRTGGDHSAVRVRSSVFNDAFKNALEVVRNEGVFLNGQNSSWQYLYWGG